MSDIKIFLSWSTSESLKLGKSLKIFLEDIFTINQKKRIDIFISDENIYSGEKWFSKLLSELKKSEIAIICLTPNNVKSVWVNFESGGIAANSESTGIIPFLLHPMELPKNNPLNNYNIIHSNSKKQIMTLVKTINENLGDKKIELGDNRTKAYINDLYNRLRRKLSTIERTYQKSAEFDIYPANIRHVIKNKVFLGAPMASTKNNEQFGLIRSNVLKIIEAIKKECNFKDIYYPGLNIKTKKDFDGKEKAIEIDFTHLKQSEYYVFIYPEKLPSSILVEIGYAIALSKKTIIFTTSRDKLPFMLEQSDRAISNLKIYSVKDMNEIEERIRNNGMALFKFGNNI